MARAFNFAMFYLGWFACVGGAARGQLWLGPVLTCLLVMVHLALSSDRIRELGLILAVGVLGFALDTLQASVGLYAFERTSILPWVCPPWMVALWMLFATTLNSSMAWLAGRYRVAAVLGAGCGPVSYLAGARLGAIELSGNVLGSLAGIGAVWAIAMPTLLVLRAALSTPGAMGRLHRTARA
jgi:Protein of unknown function (DUF2878)